VVKKVSAGIFIKHYLGKRMLGNTPAGSSVPPRDRFQADFRVETVLSISHQALFYIK